MTTKKEKIYVIGFPKSGNTWMTRLLADVTDGLVKDGGMRTGEELAKDVNSEIMAKRETSNFRIYKTHLLPDTFLNDIDPCPTRIVHITRDFRDVIVSAFFHRHPNINEEVVTNLSFFDFINPKRVLYRLYFWKDFFRICKGWGNIKWDCHSEKWREAVKVGNTQLSLVSYEKLLNSSEFELTRILKDLRISAPKEKIRNAVKRQAFSKKKKDLTQNEGHIPFGKDFQVRFLRKGISGDWVRFLSPLMLLYLKITKGKSMSSAGYTFD